MAKKFFTDWALWEKMVFILGCAIVVTVFLGILKLSYTSWRVRKYTALEKLARKVSIVREKSIIRSLSTRRKGEPKRQSSSRYKPQEKTGPDVPFGIKALESGVEVEGVWDSRPDSRRSSFAIVQTPKNGHVIDMSMVEAGLLSEDSKGSLIASTTASRQFERAVSAEQLESEPSFADVQSSVVGRKYPPHSFMRYDGIQGHRTVNTFSTLTSDGQRPSSYADSHRTSSRSSRRSRTTQQGSSPISPSSSHLVTPNVRIDHGAEQLSNSTVRSSSAHSIYAMQNRRASQVAESGQFHARFPGDGSSSRQSSTERQPRHSTDITDFAAHHSIMDEHTSRNNLNTPQIHIIGSSPPTESTMYAIAPYDADAEYMKSQFESPFRLNTRLASESTPRKSKSDRSPQRSSFTGPDRDNPQVLRQVNSGFAILRPGTLDATQTTPQAASPTDDATLSDGNIPKRSSRKLQKRRASQDSQRSSKKSLDLFEG